MTRNCRKGDYAQAAIDTAAAIGDAAGGGTGNVPSADGAGSAVLVGTGVVAAGGVGAYLYFATSGRRRRWPPARPTGSRAPSRTRWLH